MTERATPVGGISIECVVTPTISTSTYTALDQIGGLQLLMNAAASSGRVAVPLSLVIIDKARQSAEMTIYFYNVTIAPTSTDNAALSITDAINIASFIGHVQVATTDWALQAATGMATIHMPAISMGLRSQTAGGHLYAIAQIAGTSAPTYGSTSDLVFKYTFGQDIGGPQAG